MGDFSQHLRAAMMAPLDAQQALEAFSQIISGKLSDIQIAAFLGAVEARGVGEDELFSIASVLRERAKPVDAPQDAVDTCGTGGDGSGSFNISTAAALVLAGCRVPVVKHGNRAQTSRCGSADILEALGVNLEADEQTLKRCLAQASIVFLMAPRHHPVMASVAPVRRAMQVRTLFNLVGPLVNPARPGYQLVGVYDRRWLLPMARVLGRLGAKRVWVVHGQDAQGQAMDEVVLGTTHVAQWHDGKTREFTIEAGDVGLSAPPGAHAPVGGDSQDNAAILRAMFSAKSDAHGQLADLVALNAAAALCVCGRAKDLRQGVEMARTAIEKGDAMAALDAMVQATNHRGARGT